MLQPLIISVAAYRLISPAVRYANFIDYLKISFLFVLQDFAMLRNSSNK